jgi:hypothetical protein
MLVVVYVCSLANIDHTRNLFDVLINLKTGLEITVFCYIVRNDVLRVKRSMCNIQVSGNNRILLNKKRTLIL